MNITVCQLHDDGVALAQDWERLVEHARAARSELILLPEMPFYPWVARSSTYLARTWEAAVTAHDRWEKRFSEIAPTVIAATRPVDFGNERYNEGFIWNMEDGFRSVHAKAFLANREQSWEATWYRGAEAEFIPVELGASVAGFLIGAELYARDAVEQYAHQHVTLLLTPRSTTANEFNECFTAARDAARLTHAFAASSNRARDGAGWILDRDGKPLALTSSSQPYVTLDLEFPALRTVSDIALDG
jgi:predicted amidohydrolase